MNVDEARLCLAEVLRDLHRDHSGHPNSTSEADALLPTVRRIVAAELRAAADWIWEEAPARSSASAELHARAADLEALDATPDHGKA